jgi:hypothetical protein
MNMTDILEDIFRLNFLNASALEIVDVLTIIFLALVMGLFIFFVYSKTFKGVMYSSSFGVTLIMMTMITALIIYSVAINFMLSLGMVGALSIVRFRTVIKEPLDLAYLFWAITIGILVGAGFFPVAIMGGIAIGAVLFVFVKGHPKDTPYIVVVSCHDDNSEEKALLLIKERTKRHIVKAKTVTKGSVELTVEVRLKDGASTFVNDLIEINGINNASLVSYNGDFYM